MGSESSLNERLPLAESSAQPLKLGFTALCYGAGKRAALSN